MPEISPLIVPNNDRNFSANGVFVTLLVAFLIVFFDLIDGTLYLGDIDDDLRRLQIEYLIASGNWFDLTLPMISMPEPYVSPWSRVVDLPYFLIGVSLAPWTGTEAAMQVAYWVWPPVMLCVYCLLVLRTVIYILPPGYQLEMPAIVAMLVSMSLSLWEFSPGRIDHHNFQLVASLLVFLGLVKWSVSGAVLSSVGVVLSIAVGLELLPMIALVLLAIGLAFVLDRPGSVEFVRSFSASLVVVTLLAALFLLGPRAMLTAQCDAFSAPYLAALAGYGLLSLIAVNACKNAAISIRFLTLAGLGSSLVIALIVAFPSCLDGPYHMIDPLSRSMWLDRVWQEHSILLFFREAYFPQLILLATMSLIIVLAGPSVLRDWNRGGTAVTILYIAVLSSLILTVLQTRYIRFPTAFASLLLPMVLVSLRTSPKLIGRLAFVWTSVIAGLGIGLHFAVPVQLRALDEVDFLSFGGCKAADMSSLAELPPGRIIAPMALGLNMAPHLPAGVTTAGISFHRASPGIRRILQAFLSLDAETRKTALASFDYVAACRFNLPVTVPTASLFSVLTRGGDWPGLVRINVDDDGPLVLFKIDHPNIR